MRRLLKTLDVAVPVGGVLLVLAAVLFISQIRLQIAVVMLGLALVQVGVWNVASQMLPNERKYLPLRSEVDRFILLVRMLNGAALRVHANDTSQARQEFDAIKAALYEAVESIAAVAGRTESEVVINRGPRVEQSGGQAGEQHPTSLDHVKSLRIPRG